MKETNSQLFKELHQAKSDLENVKTELNHVKQNVPLDYQPGMLSGKIFTFVNIKSSFQYNLNIFMLCRTY